MEQYPELLSETGRQTVEEGNWMIWSTFHRPLVRNFDIGTLNNLYFGVNSPSIQLCGFEHTSVHILLMYMERNSG